MVLLNLLLLLFFGGREETLKTYHPFKTNSRFSDHEDLQLQIISEEKENKYILVNHFPSYSICTSFSSFSSYIKKYIMQVQ